ncbi:MAG: RC-LH1 core complex protein PufX [Pseudomonadota bacterium]
MADLDEILGTDGRGRLTADITYLMLKGAGYALVFCLALLFTVLIIAAIGRALPEDSRFTPDPLLRSSIELPATDPFRMT